MDGKLFVGEATDIAHMTRVAASATVFVELALPASAIDSMTLEDK